jgi:penicillin amidase
MSAAASLRFRLLVSVLSILLVGVILAAGGLWWLTRRSLPQLDGAATLPGLSAGVTVERDAAGVPTIHGATRWDVARALGYLHAQDRFFQMDLSRRRSAGELAELFGRAAVPIDREARIHGFRSLARKALALLPPAHRELVEAYAAGVNAGLAALRARPFEYTVLRVPPQPWQPEDTLLVGYAMVLDLQDSRDRHEQMLAAIQYSYGRTMLDFVAPEGTESDAALDGGTFPPAPVPGPEIIDLRKRKADTGAEIRPDSSLALRSLQDDGFASGSNVFALAGNRTANGSALLANDMHLHLGVPAVWYRAALVWDEETPNAKSQVPGPKAQTPNSNPQTPNAKSKISNFEPGTVNPNPVQNVRREPCRVTGVTLPGIPLVVAGSNGHIAWGFTNSYADTADIVIAETSSLDPRFYKNGVELAKMEEHKEIIRVKGGDPVEAITRWTIWGPVIGESNNARSCCTGCLTIRRRSTSTSWNWRRHPMRPRRWHWRRISDCPPRISSSPTMPVRSGGRSRDFCPAASDLAVVCPPSGRMAIADGTDTSRPTNIRASSRRRPASSGPRTTAPSAERLISSWAIAATTTRRARARSGTISRL